MRLTTVILITFFMQASAAGFAQKITLNRRNVPLEEVLKEIRKQSGFDFYYDGKVISTIKDIDVSLENASIDKAMDQVLSGLSLSYTIDGKIISIKAKESSILKQLFENIDVTGRVLNENGAVLVGATVKIKGKNFSVVTNEKGEFRINNVRDDAVLEINYIGYKVKEIKVSPNLGDIKLEVAVSNLNEVNVLVSTGYQTIAKERTTGSFGTVSSKEISKSTTFDLGSALEGKIAGVVKDQNGFTIRGKGTFLSNGSDQPLYVIDGFPVEGELQFVNNQFIYYKMPAINPDDIESITVLKDAAAASIYGARAGNGVIVITTKRAKKKGAAEVSFSTDIQVTPNYDYSYMKYMSASKYIDMQWNFVNNNPALIDPSQRQLEVNRLRNGDFIPSPSLDLMLKYYDGSLSKQEADKQLMQYRSNGVPLLDDLKKYIYQSPIIQRYALSVSKATDGINTTASFTFSNNKGSSQHTDDQSLITSLRNSINLTKWLTAEIDANLQYGKGEAPQYGADAAVTDLYPYSRLVDGSGNSVSYYRSRTQPSDLTTLKQYPNDLLPLDFSLINELGSSLVHTTEFRTRIATSLDFKLTKWLKFTSGFQYENGKDEAITLDDKDSYRMRYLYDVNTYLDPSSNTIGHRVPYGDARTVATNNSENYTWRNQLNFNYTTNDHLHSLVVLAGNEMREVSGNYSMNKVYGYNSDLLTWTDLNNYDLIQGGGNVFGSYASFSSDDFHAERENKNRYVSYYGNAAYTLMSRYDITGSIRWDKSNYFGTSLKYENRPLWSGGVAWNMMEESFMKDVKWLNRLKLRATYGVNGNIARDVSPYLVAQYSSDQTNSVTQRPYGTVSSPPNANLRWEKIKVFNLGADYTILNNRLNGTIEYYKRNSSDLLVDTQIDPTYGFSTLKQNAGDMTNSGIEMSLNGSILKKKDWGWTAGFTFAYNKNKVTKVFIQPSGTASIAAGGTGTGTLIEGYPLNSLFSYRFARINDKGDPVVYDEKGAEVSNANINNFSALVYSGSLVPLYTGGFNTSFNWKGMELSANIIYSGGNVMRKLSASPDLSAYEQGVTNLMYDGYDNAWKKPGDELKPGVTPRVTYNYDQNTTYRNQYWLYTDDKVVSASYIKLRSLTFSYDLAQTKLLSRSIFKSIRLRAQANNLFYIAANGEGSDPEAYNATNGTRTLKLKPGYSFGINFLF
ncbi:SusC/RagA family TonB-linked outer membrane protein [Mucilaginibacter gracilis]|nr:SusC/RagA family TonB-linked outer membrane protein [Mucilaginibacter gracilis]